MRPANYLPSSELLLSTLTSVSLFGAVAFAQRANDDDNNASAADDNKPSAADEKKATAVDEKAAAPTADDKKDDAAADEKAASSAKDEKADDNKAAATTADGKKDEADDAKTSPVKDDKKASPTKDNQASATADKDVPTLGDKKSSAKTSSSSTQTAKAEVTRPTSAIVAITGRPTLTRVKAIPEYPAATVPPTNNAPFMQHSSAPEGTIFIAVGAILGALGIAILLWRLIVGILLHRSVAKAAQAQHDTTTKSGFPAPPAPFYKYTDNASNMSLSAPGRGVRRTNRGPAISSVPSQSNLFFSPTAAASGGAPGNRGSAFLPSGFYAAGNTSPGGANHEHSISLTNLRPDSRGLNASRHTLSQTPPDSPGFNTRRDISATSLSLNRPPSQRAPSAFLDDLLADDPSSLPPPHMPASGGARHSYGSNSPGPQNRF